MKKSKSVPRSISRGRTLFNQLVVLLILCGLLATLSYNRQGIADYIKLRSYRAPATVASIADSDTMTPAARRIFYVNQPDIADKADFASQCPAGNEQTVVLGCYHGGQSGIFVLKVDDDRLKGIEEVTSAHEMLHAAYERLSTRQKKQVDAQLQDYFDHGLKDDAIRKQINGYKQTEPDQLVNEMHSILGTEVPHLPAALEAYYQRYFTNRATVTGLYASYESEFTNRQAAIKADDQQLSTMRSQILAAEASLKSQSKVLSDREAELNDLRANSQTADYNAAVPGYNAQVNSYNDQVAATKQLINQYNDLVSARNALALEEQQLTNEITSTVSPIGQ